MNFYFKKGIEIIIHNDKLKKDNLIVIDFFILLNKKGMKLLFLKQEKINYATMKKLQNFLKVKL